MCRARERLDFIHLFCRDYQKYDIAELPRMITYSTRFNLFWEFLEKRMIEPLILYFQNRRRCVLSVIDSMAEKEIRLGNMTITFNYIENYTKCLIENIRENAKIFSKCDFNTQYPVIEFYISETILNHLLRGEYVSRVGFSCNSYSVSANELLLLRTSSIKGIMRYTLFKLLVLYSLYDLIEIEKIDSIKKILCLLMIFSLMLTYDDETFLFTIKDIFPLKNILKKSIPLLHSIIFGSGVNRSIISLECLNEKSYDLIRYIIRFSCSSIFSVTVLSKLLRSYSREYSNSISVRDLLYGLLCLIIGSLNYVCYLDGPFVPVLPGYRRSDIRQEIDRMIIHVYLPKEAHKVDVVEKADNFLKFYVRKFILERLNLDL